LRALRFRALSFGFLDVGRRSFLRALCLRLRSARLLAEGFLAIGDVIALALRDISELVENKRELLTRGADEREHFMGRPEGKIARQVFFPVASLRSRRSCRLFALARGVSRAIDLAG